MFDFLFREKVLETDNSEKKFKIGCILKENQIDYKIKIEDINHRNIFDSMQTGDMMIKPKYVYSFWVKKDQANDALYLVRGV